MAAVLLAPNAAMATDYRFADNSTFQETGTGYVDSTGTLYVGTSPDGTSTGYVAGTGDNVLGFNNTNDSSRAFISTEAIPVNITVSGATLTNVYGGRSTLQGFSYVTVTIDSGSTISNLYGAWEQDTANVSISNITVSIGGTGTTVSGNVYGVYANTAGTTADTVTVNITDGATVGGFVRGVEAVGDVSGVDVTVSGSAVSGYVYGAYSGSGNATDSTVTISNAASVGGAVYGAYSKGNDGTTGTTLEASGNTVTITGSGTTVGGYVRGGYVEGNGTASDNEVYILDGSVVNAETAGAWTGGGIVSGNSVSIENSTVNTAGNNIYGGVSDSGTYAVSGNSVSITDSTITSTVTGGYSQGSGATSGNTVSITTDSGTTTVTGSVYGGRSVGGTVSENKVSIENSTVTAATEVDAIFGGLGNSGTVSSNEVTITGSEITSDISGGYSETSTVESNTVTIDDSTVTGNIYGGVSGSGAVTDNTLELNSGSVKGDVYAGRNNGSGAVSGNKVTIEKADVTSSVFAAGYSSGSGAVSDNTITINDGTLSGGFTYAGYSEGGGTVSGNTVYLNGGTVKGTLYAGFSGGDGKVEKNTVYLDGKNNINVEDAILYGSNIAVVTGSDVNALYISNISGFSGKIGNIGKFDEIYIDLYGVDVANAAYGSGSVIYLTDSSGSGTNLTNSTVNIYNSEVTYNDRSVVYTSASSLADAYTIVKNNNGAGYMTKTNATITEQLLFVQNPDDYSSPQYAVYELITDQDDGTISYTKTDIDPDSEPPSPSPEPTPTPEPTPGPGPAPEPTDEDKAISALAGTAAKLSMYYAQLDDLRKRLGEVRYGAQDGIWARVIYQQDSFSGTSSYGAKQKWYGLNVGVDHIISQDEDKMWLLGANFKYGHSKEKLKRQSGGKGNLNDYGVNLYATYANQYGCYADFVLSFDEYKQKLGVSSEGSSSKGDYDSWGWGASIEVGKMFSFSQNDENWGPWQSHWWIEPQAQLSYYWLNGKDFTMSSGKRVDQDNGQSLVGRLGLVVGKKWSYGGSTKVDKRYVQAYLKGGVKHEFLGKQDIKISGTRYDDRLRGTTGYYGAGIDWNLTRQLKAYAQVERESGGKYKKDIQASVGLKWQF